MKPLLFSCMVALVGFTSCQGGTTDTKPGYSADTPTMPRQETTAEQDGLSPRIDVPADSAGMAPDSAM